MNLGIVVSETYWETVTSRMLDLACKTAQENGATVIRVIKVPGSFDIPLAVKKLLKDKNIEGVVTLGAVVKGDTNHDEVIMHVVAPALVQLSLEFEKPVVLGINGPGMTLNQAMDRVSRAAQVTKACIDLIRGK